MVDARFLHWMIGYPDDGHNPHIDGFDQDQSIVARPNITWPLSCNWEQMLHNHRVDETLDMDLIAETIAENNGHSHWRDRIQFLQNFHRKKWFSISKSTINHIVQQESWFRAG